MTRLLKTVIILYVAQSLFLPSPCPAKLYADKKPSFSPFSTIIKSLSIIRPTIVINVDDLEKSSKTEMDDDNFLQYLKLLPTITQGRISGLKIVLLSRINKYKFVLTNLTLTIKNSQPGKNSLWQLTGTYEFQHPAVKTSGTIFMELALDTMQKKFNGGGKLKIVGTSSDHRYTLFMPILIHGNLVLKPTFALDDHPPVTSELQVILPSSGHPLWKVTCSGKLSDAGTISAILKKSKLSMTTMFPKSGQLHYQLDCTGKTAFFQPPYAVSLQLKAEKLQFQSTDSEVAIEDSGFSLDAGMTVPRDGSGHLKITTRFHGGPFLWHNYFWDLSDQDASGTFECKLLFRDGFPVLQAGIDFSGGLDAAPLWVGSLGGRWSPKKGIVSFTGQPMDFAKTLSVLKPEFLEEQPQILKGLTAAGHYQFSATIEQEGNKIAITGGKISISDGNIVRKGYGQVDEVEISVPLAGLSWNKEIKKLQISRQAAPLMLKFASIRGPYLQGEAQTIPVEWEAEGEKVSIPKALKVIAFGCPLTISNFILHHPLLAAQRRAELQFEIEPAPLDHHLPELPVSVKIIELINEIRHHVHAVLGLSVADNQLKVLGDLEFPVFSGQVSINNIHVRRLFSPSRVIGLNMDARKLDLQKVTSLIQAGSATGIIDMSLKNFEISYGQPSKFDLEIKSVKTSGVPRKISVEAIENLSLLSSGSSAGQGLLNVGINRFFSHYRYDKIGLYCRLRDDVFQLRGLIHQGGREYVVKRGFLTGVDIVNYNPDNRISFRDMQERILRIFNQK